MSKSPIKLIKDGIIQENWEKVKEGYTLLTGEEIESSEEAVEETISKKKPVAKKLNSKTKRKEKFDGESDRAGEIALNKFNNKLRDGFLVSGKVDLSKVKMKTPFDNEIIIDKEETIKNKKLAKQKIRQVRDEYVPDHRKCTQCGNKFDFKKVYPLGVFAGGSNGTGNLLCSTCQNNRR